MSTSENANSEITSRLRTRLCGAPRSAPRPLSFKFSDTGERETVLAELTEKLPDGTAFLEATAVWEVLVRAPDCSLVVLSGELVDGSAHALVEKLRQRCPHVPVVSLKREQLD